jgi:hypothetical protein
MMVRAWHPCTGWQQLQHLCAVVCCRVLLLLLCCVRDGGFLFRQLLVPLLFEERFHSVCRSFSALSKNYRGTCVAWLTTDDARRTSAVSSFTFGHLQLVVEVDYHHHGAKVLVRRAPSQILTTLVVASDQRLLCIERLCRSESTIIITVPKFLFGARRAKF